MKLTTPLVLATLCELALCGDDRDLSGDVWKNTLTRRQTSWSPPSALVTPLQEVWDHELQTYNNGNLLGFKNYGYDIIMAAQGSLKFCVRWESDATITEAQRKAVAASLQTNVKKWTDNLSGFMGWPFDNIPVSVTGWAVKNTNLLQGSTSGTDVYTTTDEEGIPQCDPRCGRFFHQDNDYSTCPGGADRHYDVSLWLTAGMEGGAGGDWGQRVGSEYFLSALDNPHIWLHEFGHTLALDDFYDWTPTGQTNFIMNAGSSQVVTEFDIWMMRDFWRHLASRYNLRKLKNRAIGSAQ
ncbi:cellulose-binding family ii [Phlyctema vagabunda]|uniref:Cellulose-binding family ii n=1 Tax=Phlyctema vagabunda TaxID=108571 RepID=A0ABR4P2A2_9HELO